MTYEDTASTLRPNTEKPTATLIGRSLQYIPQVPFQRRQVPTLKWVDGFLERFYGFK
jgi:hypothetical protein